MIKNNFIKLLPTLALPISYLLLACSKQVYTVTWKNYNDEILYIDNNVPKGSVPIYKGETPTKSSDESYYYKFKSWDHELVPISSNTTYVATYHSYREDWITYTYASDAQTSYCVYEVDMSYTPTACEIPDTYNDLPVSAISSGAFSDCVSLESITIPKNIFSINASSFNGCINLSTIMIDENNPNYSSLESNGIFKKETNNTFALIYGCKSTVLSENKNITTISKNAFCSCPSLTSIYIPSSVTTIEELAFCGCDNVTSVTINNNNPNYSSLDSNGIFKKEINNTFTLVFGFKSTVLPENKNITSIGNYAFNGCPSLTSIVIPNGVATLGEWAFSGCASLTSVNISNSVTTIGLGAFSSCTSLTSIFIPISVTNVGDAIFLGDTNLTDIYCEASSKPNGWEVDWIERCDATIHWNCTPQ